MYVFHEAYWICWGASIIYVLVNRGRVGQSGNTLSMHGAHRGLPLSTYALMGGGSSLLYISIAYYMQKGGGWVQIACKIAYLLNGRPHRPIEMCMHQKGGDHMHAVKIMVHW